MADNTVLNAGAGGDTIASDDIGGVKYQRVKPTLGADGAAVDSIAISNGLDSTGAGIPANGIVGQFDDTATGAVTENQFAPVRISTRRALLVEGVASGTAQPISAASLPLPSDAATETSLAALAGDVGDTADAAATAGSTGTLHAKQRLMTSQLDAIKTSVEILDNKTFDLDSGAGTDTVAAFGIAVAAAGGAAAITGDATNGLDVDVTRVGGNVTVINGGTFATQVDGAALTALQLIDNIVRTEDEASADGHSGAVILAVRQDTPAASSGTDGDYEPLKVTGGRLAVQATGSGSFTVAQATAANLNCTEASAATIATNTSNAATSLSVLDDWDNGASDGASVSGDVAHDAADAGEPVKIGGKANLDEPTAVAENDRVNAWFDLHGRQICLLGHGDPEPPVTANGSAAGVSVIAAPGASVSLHICKGSLHNSAATEAVVSLRDGAAGTIRFTANLAADGGGCLFDFGSRGWKLTANTAFVMDAVSATQYCNVTEYYIAP